VTTKLHYYVPNPPTSRQWCQFIHTSCCNQHTHTHTQTFSTLYDTHTGQWAFIKWCICWWKGTSIPCPLSQMGGGGGDRDQVYMWSW